LGYRLLVLEGDSTPPEASVQVALVMDAEFRLERVSWDAARPETLSSKAQDATVAVGVPDGRHVANFFQRLREVRVAAPTLGVLPADACGELVEAVSRGADDFLFAPIRPDELRHRLVRLLGRPRDDLDNIRERLMHEMGILQLIGSDPEFVKVLEQIPRFARSNAPVLITGETGTGKELFARAIHFLSKRRNFPFIAVDCGAVPDHLFENELFGHIRGAFTDAHRDQKGLIGMAEGGTLFLDEVDSLSLGAQSKLLRFLQERTFRRLGADGFERADVSVIAASNRDLEACVREKLLRADLYFRLNVLSVSLPPLRARRGDVELLACHFLKTLQKAGDPLPKSFSVSALRHLAAYDWPGNVRELFNVVQRAIAACDCAQLLPCHVVLPHTQPSIGPSAMPFRAARAAALGAFERHYLEDLLRKHQGNITHAAREACQDRRALGRLVKKHGITRHAL
jgi:DNA-binding NtrC family response regulator